MPTPQLSKKKRFEAELLGVKLAFTQEEAALMLGLARQTVRDMLTAGELQVVRKGSCTLIPRAECVRWLSENLQPYEPKPHIRIPPCRPLPLTE